MKIEKLRRIAAAATAAAVVLLFILVSVMVYQMISINGRKAKIDDLNRQIQELEEEKNATENKIDLWLSDWKIEERARELDYIYPGDKN